MTDMPSPLNPPSEGDNESGEKPFQHSFREASAKEGAFRRLHPRFAGDRIVAVAPQVEQSVREEPRGIRLRRHTPPLRAAPNPSPAEIDLTNRALPCLSRTAGVRECQDIGGPRPPLVHLVEKGHLPLADPVYLNERAPRRTAIGKRTEQGRKAPELGTARQPASARDDGLHGLNPASPFSRCAGYGIRV